MSLAKPVKKPTVKRAVGHTDDSTSKGGLKSPSAAEINGFRKSLLNWYDRNRRSLPWRATQGQGSPYHVWLSEIMLQQTVVAAVIPYFTKFVEKWPRVEDLAAADTEEVMKEWAGLGYYARARNLHKCARIITHEHNGVFPDTQEGLRDLPGIGEYTSAAIAAIAFDRPATVIDGNVDRVVARYFAVEEPFPEGKKQVRHFAQMLSEGRSDRPGDFAQAMMDLGATVCIPKNPRCTICPVAAACHGRLAGIQDELPRKALPKAKPHKHGYVYWITDSKGRVLLERRDEVQMMGGMLGLPVSSWELSKAKVAHDPVFSNVLDIRAIKGIKVMHSFTHFDLTLAGYAGKVDKTAPFRGPRYVWVAAEDVAKAGLPSLFVKAVKLFRSKKV
jgi:A/G-specific adenine glycosylase